MSNPQPGGSARLCTKCGYPMAAWEDTCTYCGLNQGVVCQQCGSAINSGTLFCPYCGTRAPLPGAKPNQTAPQPPPRPQAQPTAQPATQPAAAPSPQTDQVAAAPPQKEAKPTAQPSKAPPPPTAIKPPPVMKDPIDSLASELGISYVRAKRIYDEGLGIEELQKMRVEKVAKVVGDPGIASAIKQKIGHIYTEGEMDEICHEVSSDIDALVSFATKVGFNMDEMKRAVDYLRTITREKKVKEAIEYAEQLKGASVAFHQEAIRKARVEIEAAASKLDKHKIETRTLVECIAKIDVALGMNDYPGARRAAITGIDAAKRSLGEMDTVEGSLREINEAIDLARSLSLQVDDLKNDATSAERLIVQGEFDEAKKTITECRKELGERIASNLKSMILAGKRKLLDLKMGGQNIKDAKMVLDSVKDFASKGETGKALSAFLKFKEICPEPTK